MASRVRISVFLTIALLLLLNTFYVASSLPHGAGGDRWISSGSFRSSLSLQKNNQIPNCRQMASKSECLQNSKCRWCLSGSIDDMCFSTYEAWRLPQQVFSCE
uniref:Uncharacterized protein n=1 Tax=Nelumbo nucifera TaxID=4432 RepID=A0A822Z231_NELNU|nr:TPA_asm: hypothetical protein HUJ06_008382 [Nelumbo nucifera]